MRTLCKKWRAGFTLVEMCVVIGILAIICAIAVPWVLTAKADAKATKLAGDARTYNDALLRARLKDDNHPAIATNATNAHEAINYLIDSGYVTRK